MTITGKRRLGQGGFGSAFLGKGGTKVSKYQHYGPNALREYEALKRARHKGISSIVKLIGKAKKKPSTYSVKRGVPAMRPHTNLKNYVLNTSTGQPFISKIELEYIPGSKSLRNYYKKDSQGNPVPLPAQLSKAVKNAVQLMHAGGIIHGDLHADNILVVEKGNGSYNVKIIDFGKSLIRTSKHGGGFRNANNANAYLKNLAKKPNGTLNSGRHWTGKVWYRARKNKGGNGHTHFSNKNFINRMI